MVMKMKCRTGRWEWTGAKHNRDLQDIERLAIEKMLSYIEGRQHMTSALKIAEYYETYVLRYCCPLQGTVSTMTSIYHQSLVGSS
jgi:hypothetical protein